MGFVIEMRILSAAAAKRSDTQRTDRVTKRQQSFLTNVLAVTPVCDYDRTVAEHHADLLAHVQRRGERRGAHDLLIAATARATGRTLLSTDSRARFSELLDVAARLIVT